MSFNTFGQRLRMTTFGESHGVMIGAVLDGCPANIPLDESDIQPWLNRRKPGLSKFTTQRAEADEVQIVSGVFNGKTTGTPIGLIIQNTDQRSKDYSKIAQKFRPAHADYTYFMKYGNRDYRGGGRASARETAMRVACGAIADKILKINLGESYKIQAGLVQMGKYKLDSADFKWHEVDNDFYTPCNEFAQKLAPYLDAIRKNGSSIGAILQCHAYGIPAGLGAPIYGKLSADLAAALMSINAVKAVEIGDGFNVAELSGEENADEMRYENGEIQFLSNHAGGILGGISSGQPIITRIAVKPTSSILNPVRTISADFENTTISTTGRHDPCVGIRAVPIMEAMVALTICDHYLRAK